jgi:NADPH:quinone reductase-like Zn-dependent oxidoreductase
LGGDVVVVDGDGMAQEVQSKTGGAPIRLALDGVSGEASGRLAAVLSSHGMLVAYASMSEKPMIVSPLNVIFKPLTLRGFWLGHPEFNSKAATAMREAAKMIASGDVSIGVAGVFPLGEVKKAAARAAKGAKVLLEIAPLSA